MRRGPISHACAPALAVACLVAVVAAAAGPQQQEVAGMVRAVDPAAGTLDVVTGVGFAAWVVRVRVDESTEVTVDGQAAALDAIEPGDPVRVAYRETPEGNVAETVRTIEVAGAGGGR